MKQIMIGIILNECAVFIGFVLLAVGVWTALRYIEKEWSFIPRRRQRRGFGERL
jgi:hypothetical protein